MGVDITPAPWNCAATRLCLSGTAPIVYNNITGDISVDLAGIWPIQYAIVGTQGQFSILAGVLGLRSHTRIIGTSNAVHPSLDQIRVDALCNGVADDIIINAEIAAVAAAGGGTVYLSDGTYVLAAPIVILANVQLEGTGRSSFIDGDALLTTNHAIVISAVTDCKVRNLAIQTEDGGGKLCHCIFIEDGANNFEIDRVIIVDSDSDGIHVEGTDILNGSIHNCHIEDVDAYGISVGMDALNTMTRLLIYDNIITGAGNEGVSLLDIIYSVVKGNVIHTNGWSGIHVRDSDYTIISENVVPLNGQWGIRVRDSSHITVNNNISFSNATDGIMMENSDSCTVEGNTANTNGLDGIQIEGLYNDITDNICLENGRHGVNLLAAASHCNVVGNIANENDQHGINVAGHEVSIKGNYCYHNSVGTPGNFHGIYLTGTADRCQVNDNYCSDDGTTQEDGIHLADGAALCSIVGNYVYNLTGDGIRLFGNNTGTLIEGNHCYFNDENGIVIEDSNNCNVNGNHCALNAHHGIYLNNTDYAVVGGNYTYFNRQHGIFILQSEYALVSSNWSGGNSQAAVVTWDNICIDGASLYCSVSGNKCFRFDARPRFGLNIAAAGCLQTMVHGNDLHDAGNTADYNDAGVNTKELGNRVTLGWLGVALNNVLVGTGVGTFAWGALPAGALPAHAPRHIRVGVDPIIGALDARALALTTHGDISFRAAAANTLARLGIGPIGNVLTSAGPAADPIWAAAPGGVWARGKSQVVAASNAMDLVNADFFCGGANDEVQINLAIVAVNAVGGGVVYLSEGLFVINASITMLDNVMLQGTGHGTIIQIAAGVVVTQAIGEAAVNGHIGLKDFTIDGNSGTGSQGEGVFFTNAPYTFITGLYIHDTASAGVINFGGSGIYLDNCDYSIIMNNWVHDCGTCILFVVDAGIQALNSTACIIANNIMTDCTLPCALFDTCTFSSIAGNVAFGAVGHGFQITNTTVCSITRNVASGNAIYGLDVGVGCEYNLLSLNICDQNAQTGMNIGGIGHNVISSNVISRNGLTGLIVGGDHNVITSNSAVENNQSGGASGNISVSGDYNLIASNTARSDPGSPATYGLSISVGATENEVHGNDLRQGGITDYIDAGTDTLERDNRVTEGWYSLPIQLEHWSTRYYSGPTLAYYGANLAILANYIYALPFVVSKWGTYDRIAIDVRVAAAGNAKIGIYRDNNGYPGALILDSGNVAVNGVGVAEAVINQVLPAGWYWLAVVSDVAPSLRHQYCSYNTAAQEHGWPTGVDIGSYGGLRGALVFPAALPNPYPAAHTPWNSTRFPKIMLRRL